MAIHRVKYVGLSDERHMSKSDLDAANVFLSEGLYWTPENRKVQYVRDAGDDLLEVLKNEGTFQVEEVDEAGVPTGTVLVEPDRSRLDDTAMKVVEASKPPTPDAGKTAAPTPVKPG